METVLVIEDDKQLSDLLKLELLHEGYKVDVAADGKTGLEKIENSSYDVVLLDIMLPLLNGNEVCRRVRKFSNIPIIMITARDQIMDKVTGLDTGADDYMTKPFSIEELFARIRSVLRRNSQNKTETDILSFKHISLNRSSCEVKMNQETIELTKKEYQVLVYLLENKNNVLTREQILSKVWGYDYIGDTNVVDVYISYLRSKLNDSADENIITTVRGIGYIMKEH